MSKRFAQLPENMREALSTNAGIILGDFDPEAPGEAAEIKANILFATSGGVSVSCAMTTRDFGSDIDNCPKNTKELLEIESYECTLSGTALTVKGDTAVSIFGAADKTTSESDVETVQPRMTLKPEDFKTLWYVCPYGTAGGFVAIKLENALSIGGFSMQSTDKDKGKFAFNYKGYSSIEDPDKVPFTFYLKARAEAAAAQVDIEEGEAA